MYHPSTRLQWISQDRGFGVFATAPIPRGTITWVFDDLTIVVSKQQLLDMPAVQRDALLGSDHCARAPDGSAILEWDHARYINHSCRPNVMISGMLVEVAICDIPAGAEILYDYGTLHLDVEPFGRPLASCACGEDSCRGVIRSSDAPRFMDHWTAEFWGAMEAHERVDQPLWPMVPLDQRDIIRAVLAGSRPRTTNADWETEIIVGRFL